MSQGKKERLTLKGLLKKISPNGEADARGRARMALSQLLWGMLSWVLSGGVFIFGTQPFSLVLLCVSESTIVGVFSGILIACLWGRAPLPLLWGATVVFIFRMILSFMPEMYGKRRDGTRVGMGELMLIEDGSDRQGARESKTSGVIRMIESLFAISRGGVEPQERKRYSEGLPAKALFSSVGGFVYGLFALIGSNYSFYSMFGAFSLIATTPILVVLLSGADSEGVCARSWKHSLSWAALMCLAVYSSKETAVIGMQLSPLLCTCITLFLTGTRGLSSGILMGGVLGLIYYPLYSPLLIICAVLYGFLSPIRKGAGIAAVCGGILLWCYYFGGVVGIVDVMTPMLVGVPLSFLSERYYGVLYPDRVRAAEELPKRSTAEAGIYFAEAVSERNKSESMTDRLGALSEAFSSLSATFNGLVDRFRRPDILGLKKIVDTTLEQTCAECRNRDICWGAGYSQTLDAARRLTSALHSKGVADIEDLPREFSASCLCADALVSDVNSACERITRSIMENEKIGSFASNFDDIGAILRDALEGRDEEYFCDIEAGDKIYELLCQLGYKVKGVVVCGKRSKRVLIKGLTPDKDNAGELSAALCRKLSQLVGTPLIGPVFEMSSRDTVMSFYSKPKLCAICSHGRLAAAPRGEYEGILKGDGVHVYTAETEDGQICGDCTRVFVNENSYFYSMISDGMGSGAEAALSSEVSSMFVEKMLLAGNRADVTVRMLNNFLRTENIGLGRECSATLDLFELDLMSGSACFIKSGAAPTYICRGSTVYKVNSRTMPVGIIKEADAKLTRFDIKVQDIVVMISDGCCPDSEDCPWLVDHLSRIKLPAEKSTPEELEKFTSGLKDKILSLAVEHTPPERAPDDISVSVVLVSE